MSPVSECQTWCISVCICLSLSSFCNQGEWEDPEQCLFSMNPLSGRPQHTQVQGKGGRACLLSGGCSTLHKALVSSHQSPLFRSDSSPVSSADVQTSFKLPPGKAQRGPAQACGCHMMKNNQVFWKCGEVNNFPQRFLWAGSSQGRQQLNNNCPWQNTSEPTKAGETALGRTSLVTLFLKGTEREGLIDSLGVSNLLITQQFVPSWTGKYFSANWDLVAWVWLVESTPKKAFRSPWSFQLFF